MHIVHSVTKKRKLSLPEGRPTQCGSWRHRYQTTLRQPIFHITSHQDGGIFGSKVSIFHYFCIIFSFVVILMKFISWIDTTEWKLRNFFGNFPFIFSSRKRCFLFEKRDFNIFQFGKPSIRDPLGHEICHLMIQSIGLSQRNTGIFSRIFPPYHSPETIFKVQKSAKKNRIRIRKMSLYTRFRHSLGH